MANLIKIIILLFAFVNIFTFIDNGNAECVVCCIIMVGYIIYDLQDRYQTKNENKVKVSKKEKKNKINIKQKKEKIKQKKEVLVDDSNNNINNKKNNSLNDLLNYKVGDEFYINGVDCSIIFCDSNKENILKNYKILSNNINDKLVNGYTLTENIMIKNICTKLNISNLGSIDINNLSILNFVSVDEYNFLKNIFEELEQ